MAKSESIQAFETFKLGALELSGFEVPELVTLGGDQAHTVKDFPGGDRQVQSFGYHRRPLNWSGILVGPEALKRHQALEAMGDAGKPVPWSFGNQLADVLITRYHADLLDRFEIHYSLDLVVVKDHVKPPPGSLPDANAQILAGLQQASAAITSGKAAWAPAGLSALFAQWAVELDWLFPWTDLAQDSLNQIMTLSRKLETEIERFMGPLILEAKVIADLEALISAEEALAGVRRSRIAIGNYLLGQAVPGVWVAGTNVWNLGSQLYGDISRGLDILVGNSLRDPKISAPTRLTVFPGL